MDDFIIYVAENGQHHLQNNYNIWFVDDFDTEQFADNCVLYEAPQTKQGWSWTAFTTQFHVIMAYPIIHDQYEAATTFPEFMKTINSMLPRTIYINLAYDIVYYFINSLPYKVTEADHFNAYLTEGLNSLELAGVTSDIDITAWHNSSVYIDDRSETSPIDSYYQSDPE